MGTEELPIGLLDPADPQYEEEGERALTGRRTIVVIVYAPKVPDPKRFRFHLDETVGEAAKVAAEAFEYEVGTPSLQTKDGTVLDRGQTLEAAGVDNRDELELVDAGGGV